MQDYAMTVYIVDAPSVFTFSPTSLFVSRLLGGPSNSFNLPACTWTPASSAANLQIIGSTPNVTFLSANPALTIATIDFAKATRGNFTL